MKPLEEGGFAAAAAIRGANRSKALSHSLRAIVKGKVFGVNSPN